MDGVIHESSLMIFKQSTGIDCIRYALICVPARNVTSFRQKTLQTRNFLLNPNSRLNRCYRMKRERPCVRLGAHEAFEGTQRAL